MALIFIGCFFIGWNESICLTNSTILVRDQREIGVAGGTAGSVRAALSAVFTAIYSAILTNRLSKTVTSEVPAAVINAGLPSSSAAQFVDAITVGTTDALDVVPGVTAQIIAVGQTAYKHANADAYRTVYLTTIAFSGLAVILSFFAPNTEKLMTGQVAATLYREDTKLSSEKFELEEARSEA
jgi:hypothetical protein